jgi:hypothetical protein
MVFFGQNFFLFSAVRFYMSNDFCHVNCYNRIGHDKLDVKNSFQPDSVSYRSLSALSDYGTGAVFGNLRKSSLTQKFALINFLFKYCKIVF